MRMFRYLSLFLLLLAQSTSYIPTIRHKIVKGTTPATTTTKLAFTTHQQNGFAKILGNQKTVIYTISRSSSWLRERTTDGRERTTDGGIQITDTVSVGGGTSSSIGGAAVTDQQDITKEQRSFLIGYMNKHHVETFHIPTIVLFSEIGNEMIKANTWSGGSYMIVTATLLDVSLVNNYMKYNVTIQKRNQPTNEYRMVQLSLNPQPIRNKKPSSSSSSLSPMIGTDEFYNRLVTPSNTTKAIQTTPIDDIIRLFCRICWFINTEASMCITGKLIQLGIQCNGIGIGKLPENMYLNQVPHNVYVRQWFYDQAAIAIHDTVKLIQQKKIRNNRHKAVTLFPETNPSMDSYRIGTLLELIRSVTLRLVLQDQLRVRICVQSSMGVGIFTGVPKQLSGVMKLLQLMDWQSEIGEDNEGIVGEYVRFGAIGPDHVYDTIRDTYNDTMISQYQDDVFLIIAPQSMVGTDTSIIPLLSDMCTKIGNDRPIILFNPDLTDKISSGGQQSIRGRQERINFANTFTTCFQFQNIYVSGTSYFPILGAITKLHPEEPYIAYQRRDYSNNEGEVYIPVLAGESMPDGEMILSAFDR